MSEKEATEDINSYLKEQLQSSHNSNQDLIEHDQILISEQIDMETEDKNSDCLNSLPTSPPGSKPVS